MAEHRYSHSDPSASDTASNPADAVSVGTRSTTLVAANPNRISVSIVNTHASQYVEIALGATAEAGKGVRLYPGGGSWMIDDYTGVISAIASGASTTVQFTEV